MTLQAAPTPSNMPHQALSSVRDTFVPLDQAADEVLYLMAKFLDAGYDPDVAAHLTQISLDNVMEDD